jgi:hypothetical protein
MAEVWEGFSLVNERFSTMYASLKIKHKTTLSVCPYLLVLLQLADSKHLAGEMVSNDSYLFINQSYKNFTNSTRILVLYSEK